MIAKRVFGWAKHKFITTIGKLLYYLALCKYCHLQVGRTAHFLIRACIKLNFSCLKPCSFQSKQFSSIITWVHFSPIPFIEVMSCICNTVKFFCHSIYRPVIALPPGWCMVSFIIWKFWIFVKSTYFLLYGFLI